MRVKNLIFVIFFLVFCTERLQRIFYIGFFDLYPTRVLFIVLLITFSFKEFWSNVSRNTRELIRTVLLYLCFVFVSVLFSEDFFYSFKKWMDLFTSFFFIFLFYEFFRRRTFSIRLNKLFLLYRRNLEKISILIFVGALFLIRQIQDGENIRSFLGVSFERRISLFSDANFLGVFLSMMFFILGFAGKRQFKLTMLAIIITLVLTGSKGALLSLVLTLLFHYRDYISFLKSRIAAFSIVFAFALTLFFMITSAEKVIEIFAKSEYSENTSIQTGLPRIIVWSAGFNEFLKSPVVGLGPGNIVRVDKGSKSDIVSFAHEVGFYGLDEEKMDDLATHSNYLEILYEQGIVSFLLFILFMYHTLRTAKKLANVDNTFLGLYLGLISFFIATFSLSYLPHFFFLIVASVYYFYDKLSIEKEFNARA